MKGRLNVSKVSRFFSVLHSWEFDDSRQDGPYQKVEFRWKILQGGTFCFASFRAIQKTNLSNKGSLKLKLLKCNLKLGKCKFWYDCR